MPERSDYLAIGEAVVTAIAALFLLAVQRFELAAIAVAFGLLITFDTLAVPMKVETKVKKLTDELRVGISILNESDKVKDEFADIKEIILSKAKKDMEDLAHNKIFDGIYYKWLIKQTDDCKNSLKAVSTMPEDQWITIRQEQEYYFANKRARRRKVDVERVFITSSLKHLEKKESRKIIVAHLADDLRAFVMTKDEIKPHRSVLTEIREGMTIFDETILYIDEVTPPGPTGAQEKLAGGRLVDDAKAVRRFVEIFEQIKPASKICSADNVLSKIIGRKNLLEEMDGVFVERYGMSFKDFERMIKNGKKTNHDERFDYDNWKRIIDELSRINS